MRTSFVKRCTVTALAIGLATLTTGLAGAAGSATQPKSGAVESTATHTDDEGTLTATVTSTGSSGRIITSVSDGTTAVVDGSTALVAGVPATVTVTETLATGVDGWYVNLGLDRNLCDVTDLTLDCTGATNQILKDHVTVTAGSLVPTLSLALGTDGLTTDQPTMSAVASDTSLASAATLFYVVQDDGGTFTGTYTSDASFKLDIGPTGANYQGATTTLQAPYTVTLWE